MTTKARWLAPALAASLLSCGGRRRPPASAGTAGGDAYTVRGGLYADLLPVQRRLVDDFYARINTLLPEPLDPATNYDQRLSLSTRTTFEAVTHALLGTTLTDPAGQPLGTALDVVAHVDAVHGSIAGTGGDNQFRVYVRLEPDALDRLERSREFVRDRDNKAFHKGYPVCYRQEGRAPSIQISVSRDGKRADIDVDYRSSSFPAALVNGHLSAANSDVRAGNNEERHKRRWLGFQKWWAGLFGLTLASLDEEPVGREGRIPPLPRAGSQSVEEAVADFLTAWLVEGQVNEAAAYVSRRALACRLSPGDDPAALDRGIAPYQIALSLRRARVGLAPHATLGGVVFAHPVKRDGLRSRASGAGTGVTLYDVPDNLALELDCETRLGLAPPPDKPPKRSYGSYVLSAMRLELPSRPGLELALLWARQQKSWRIVSYSTTSEVEQRQPPSLLEEPSVTIAEGTAPADLIEATRAFHESWLVARDIDTALKWVAPPTLSCVNRALPEGEPPIQDERAQRRRLRRGMERVSELVGPARELADVIYADRPTHPDVAIVRHPLATAFSLVRLPATLGGSMRCDGGPRQASAPGAGEREYFATGFGIRLPGEDGGAILDLLWDREPEGWRIVAYRVEAP